MNKINKIYRSILDQIVDDIDSYENVVINEKTDELLKEEDGKIHTYDFGPLNIQIDDSLGFCEVKVK